MSWMAFVRGKGLGAMLLVVGLLTGCFAPKTCTDSTQCAGDQTCVSGTCIQRTCRSSQDCTIGSHCDPVDGLCKSGCVEETDCPYGQTCVEGTCDTKPCRSTTLDCSVGEYCDPLTGTCFQAAGPYCKPCTTASECGTDARCTYISGEGPWCAPACDASRPCPAGYTCTPFTNSGSVISYNCVTLCQNIPAE